MIKASTQRLIVIMGSFALLIGTIYTGLSLVYPSFNVIRELRAERQNKANLINTQNDAEKKIGDLTKQYEGLSTTQDAFSLMLPIKPDIAVLMNQLQGIAKNNSLRLRSTSLQYLPIRQEERMVARGLGVLRINMALSGNYNDLKKLISELETNVRIIDVNYLRVEGGAIPRRDSLSYNLTIDAYYQAE